MLPGELLTDPGEHALNPGRRTLIQVVQNTGDRPIQVGSHCHFAETNAALQFDRPAAHGLRLKIAPGTAVRFEPGQQRAIGWWTTPGRVRSTVFAAWSKESCNGRGESRHGPKKAVSARSRSRRR